MDARGEPDAGERGAPRQPLVIRFTHWANVILVAIMAASGLQILAAYPFLGARGALYAWYPLQGRTPPAVLEVGGWLAGARHWHFAFAWLFVANAAVYAVYALASGEWRSRVFLPRRDGRDAWQTFRRELRFRRAEPSADGQYSGLQRLAYSVAVLLAVLLILSGLALYEPVQLPHLTAALGGYDAARAIHLIALAALAGFLVVHVVQVLRHPGSFTGMVTGGRRRKESRA